MDKDNRQSKANPKATKSAKNMRNFLKTLPNQEADQTEVNKAVKEIREGNLE